jgi:hypothetical protein
MAKTLKALTDLTVNRRKVGKGDVFTVESPYAASCLVRASHAAYYDGPKDADVETPVRATYADPTDGPAPLPSRPAKAAGKGR